MPKKKFKPLELPLNYPGGDGWFVPVRKVQVDEKTFALILKTPVQRGTALEIQANLGISRKILHRLERAGFIKGDHPSPFISMYYYSDILDFLDKTREDPDFWNDVRREAYIRGERLENSKCL